MILTFLGTGTSQGIPVIACDCDVCTSLDPHDKRLRTAVMFTINDINIVIDVGPDFRQQMLTNKVQDIHSILLTHEHNDHVMGLDDVRPFNFKYRKSMSIYCSKRVIDSLTVRFHYAFGGNPYPGAPRLELKEITKDTPFEIEGQQIIPIEVMHGRMTVLGFRFGDITYITDAKVIEEKELEKIKGSKILIINALRKETHHSHFSLQEALALINQIKPEKAYLTHLSHSMGLAKEIEQQLPENVSLAYDNLSISI